MVWAQPEQLGYSGVREGTRPQCCPLAPVCAVGLAVVQAVLSSPVHSAGLAWGKPSPGVGDAALWGYF